MSLRKGVSPGRGAFSDLNASAGHADCADSAERSKPADRVDHLGLVTTSRRGWPERQLNIYITNQIANADAFEPNGTRIDSITPAVIWDRTHLASFGRISSDAGSKPGYNDLYQCVSASNWRKEAGAKQLLPFLRPLILLIKNLR